ncbi:MAG TPA: assimilatory sulfite reductase (NADPH) hemoprotein subunit [Gammaproteobacteria bacterium]
MTDKAPSPVEGIKERSRFLRGTLEQSLADPVTGALGHDDVRIIKFHGVYQQDDRDLRAERAAQKLEPAYNFMVRIRIPGGVLTPAQWLAVDALAAEHAGAAMRLTTRQSIQLHGVLKRNLKRTIRAINDCLLTTIAACGDVNRTVVCTALPEQSKLHREVYAHAQRVNRHLLPATRAYHEVWLDGEKTEIPAGGEEPIYGATYMPRKFKIGFALPPSNDVDIYANDLAFIAVARDGELVGFNVAVGGGMGMTHGNPRTYPRLAETIGFCRPEQVIAVAEHVVGVQRDFGDRSDRSHARLKYTIDDRGIDWFRGELERRLGFSLEPAVPVRFTHTGDRFGWVTGEDGREHLTLRIPGGRIRDDGERRFRTGLNAIAAVHEGDFRITPNQNLIVANVPPERRADIERLVAEHGLDAFTGVAPLERDAMSCVALPSCGLAMAESERYLPEIAAKVVALLEKHGLEDEEILLRVTGCPNGCARPYVAEIALVGKAPGRYNLFLGGGRTGERLNELVRQNLAEGEILAILDELFADYARGRLPEEGFGDFLHRAGVVGAPAGERRAAAS